MVPPFYSIHDDCPALAPSPATNSPRLGRTWLQFRLGSLIFVTVLGALAITWWRQWKLAGELERRVQELHVAQLRIEMLEATSQVVRAIDMKNPEHRRLKTIVDSYQPLWDSVQRHQVQIENSDQEILIFQPSLMLRGIETDFLAVLIHKDRIVDYMIHNIDDWPSDLFKDVQLTRDPAAIVLQFEEWPSSKSRGSKPYTVRYEITTLGIGPAIRDTGKP